MYRYFKAVRSLLFQYRGCGLIFLCLMMTITQTAGADNGPTPTICTDKALYFEDDTLQGALSCWNLGESMNVDFYLAFLHSSGAFYFIDQTGALSVTVAPRLKNIPINSPLEVYWVPFIDLKLSPLPLTGTNIFYTVLTQTGSLNPASDISDIWFTISPPIASHYYVDGASGSNANSGLSWSDALKTITYALSKAGGNEGSPAMIHAAAGTYATSTNGETYPLTMKANVYVSGESAATTILDAEGGAYHVIVVGRLFTLVENFTITGGRADGAAADQQQGGGVYCPDFSKAIFQNNVIQDNQAVRGAGIYFNNGSPVIHHNTLQYNAAEEGGAIYVSSSNWASVLCNTIRDNTAQKGGGIYCTASSPEMRNNVIAGNSAEQEGGGIHYVSGSSLIANNMIKENRVHGADVYGGGVFCHESATPTLRNNAIIGNQAIGENTSGGGIFCHLGGAPKILNNTIKDNVSNGNSSGQGGGVYCQKSGNALEIKNCTIFNNTASHHGGGIRVQCGSPLISNNTIHHNIADQADGGGIGCNNSSAVIVNNTVVYNTAPNGKGGGVWADSVSTVSIKDCLLYDNTATTGSDLDSPTNPSYSFIGVWSGGGAGNITGNPLLVIGPYGRYYLDPKSPCIDVGSQGAVAAGMNSMTTLAAGAADSGKVDIGCHYRIP